MIAVISVLYIFVNTASATTWYVDAANGNDGWSGTSLGWPKEHISAVLEDGSFGDNDTVILRNNDYFADEGIMVESLYCHYYIENDDVTIQKYSSDNSKPRIIAYEQAGDTLRQVFVVEGANFTIEKIKFNGSHPVSGIDAELHNVIEFYKDSDGPTISECEFRNFGAEATGEPPGDHDQFQAIIGTWPYGGVQNSVMNGITIDKCYFINNPFTTSHGHEIYLNNTRDAIISNNTIHQEGLGDPIKLRNDCQGTIIRDNKMYVAYYGFVVDWPNSSSEGSSSDT